MRVDVDVAVIDRGIDLDHPDLNVAGGVDCLDGTCETGGDDDHSHGTHVGGTIAALDNNIGVVGVAPGARLWAVKVCDSGGSCPGSAIIAGINWVAENADKIEVANMSLGGSGYFKAEDEAIQACVDNGVAFAVAAGKVMTTPVAIHQPAQFNNCLTVSALADFDGKPGGDGSPTCRNDQDDTLAGFSNWGDAVDIAAPGVCIRSTVLDGKYGRKSGTSMASPHAASAMALLASGPNPPSNATDVYELYEQVKGVGNFAWTDDSGDGTKEPLLDVSTFNAKVRF